MSTNLKKIRCTLEFNGKTFMVSVPPYKRISFLKQQAHNFFYPITSEIKLVYQNKDITSHLNNLIGDIFRNKEAIYIRLFPLDKDINITKTSLQKKKNANNQNTYNYSLTKSTEPNVSGLKTFQLCTCKKGMIEYLCRSCKIFICSNCRKSDSHFYHSVLDVDINNLEESAKLYAITIQSEILYNTKSIREDYKKFQKSNFIDASVRNEIFLRKLQEVQDLYQKMMTIVALSNEKMNNMDSLISDYATESANANKEIEKILVDIYNIQKGKNGKGKRNMTFEEFKDICENLNAKEINFIEKSCDLLSYRINYDITNKMDALYDKLEKIVDDVLKSEIPLKLDINSYYTYEIIKNIKEGNHNEEDNQHQDTNNNIDYYYQKEQEEETNNIDPIPPRTFDEDDEQVNYSEHKYNDHEENKPSDLSDIKKQKIKETQNQNKKKGDCFLPIIPQQRGPQQVKSDVNHSMVDDDGNNILKDNELTEKEKVQRFNTLSNEEIDYNKNYLDRKDVNENLYKLEDTMKRNYDFEPRAKEKEQEDNFELDDDDINI